MLYSGVSEKIILNENYTILILLHWVGEGYLNALSIVLVGLGVWLIIDGVLSIVKYSKQSFPEQLIRAKRTTVGILLIIVGIVQN